MKTFLEHFNESVENPQHHISIRNATFYHGSNVEFNVFDFERFGQTDCGTMGAGFYLTQSRELAQTYAENATRYRQTGEPVVLEFQVNTKKTLVIDANNKSIWYDKMRELNIDSGNLVDDVSALKVLGYDSIMSMEEGGPRELVLYYPGMSVRV